MKSLPSEEQLDEEMQQIEKERRILIEQEKDTPEVMEQLKLRFQALLILSARVASEE